MHPEHRIQCLECCPLRGQGVEFDPQEALDRSYGPTVGRMGLLATCHSRDVGHNSPFVGLGLNHRSPILADPTVFEAPCNRHQRTHPRHHQHPHGRRHGRERRGEVLSREEEPERGGLHAGFDGDRSGVLLGHAEAVPGDSVADEEGEGVEKDHRDDQAHTLFEKKVRDAGDGRRAQARRQDHPDEGGDGFDLSSHVRHVDVEEQPQQRRPDHHLQQRQHDADARDSELGARQYSHKQRRHHSGDGGGEKRHDDRDWQVASRDETRHVRRLAARAGGEEDEANRERRWEELPDDPPQNRHHPVLEEEGDADRVDALTDRVEVFPSEVGAH
mmetsp:Transcript_31940/g.75880  ORF Transcript_31940/g.75880 Transcript_31940/m.75880 type:complete len:330 (-) Transcript_31940:488-1477(-)